MEKQERKQNFHYQYWHLTFQLLHSVITWNWHLTRMTQWKWRSGEGCYFWIQKFINNLKNERNCEIIIKQYRSIIVKIKGFSWNTQWDRQTDRDRDTHSFEITLLLHFCLPGVNWEFVVKGFNYSTFVCPGTNNSVDVYNFFSHGVCVCECVRFTNGFVLLLFPCNDIHHCDHNCSSSLAHLSHFPLV